MTTCKKCLVELEDDMKSCPLCGTPVNSSGLAPSVLDETHAEIDEGDRRVLHRILWQVTAILLLSGIVATLIIDISINMAVTWSVYPMAICLIVLSYASFLAFWRTWLIFQLLAGWALSTLLLVACSYFFPAADWTVSLGIPILFAVNFISILLLGVFKVARSKSLNLVAIVFVAIAVLCIIVESILSLHFKDKVELTWSIIVAACLLPVTAALIFMHYRARKSSTLHKIFHT